MFKEPEEGWDTLVFAAGSIRWEHMSFADEWRRLSLTPGIDGMFDGLDKVVDRFVASGGGIDLHNLIDGREMPLIDVPVADQIIPVEKAVFPILILAHALICLTTTGGGNRRA